MVNYGNGKIYKLECLTTGLIYIGSTTKQYLSQRLVHHKKDYIKYLRGQHKYMTSFKIIENDNYRIELLEEIQCENRDQLHAREGYYIRTLDCTNKCIMGKTQEEKLQDKKDYYQANQDRIKANNNARYYTNIDTIKESRNKPCVCECGGKFTQTNRSQHLKSIKHQKYIV